MGDKQQKRVSETWIKIAAPQKVPQPVWNSQPSPSGLSLLPPTLPSPRPPFVPTHTCEIKSQPPFPPYTFTHSQNSWVYNPGR